jgi:hypothetical protein
MKKLPSLGLAALLLFFVAGVSAQDVVHALVGTIEKLDSVGKTIGVKTADGTVHTVHFVGRTTVHGAEGVATGSKDAFHGLTKGSEVVVHYTTKGTEDTAEEVDHVGKEGLKVSEGTISHIDRGAKTIAIKSADGTEETFRLTGHAAKDAGTDIAEGTEKTAHVTVYYTEDAGHKVAHFFKKAVE